MLWELLCGSIVIAALVFEWARRYHSVRILLWLHTTIRENIVEGDEELFRQPPRREDCPVCFLRLPVTNEQVYQACCGKMLCIGCVNAVQQRAGTGELPAGQCPFCRAPFVHSQSEKLVERLNARIAMNDTDAISHLGRLHINGECGILRDDEKGIEMISRAAELGNVTACSLLGNVYHPYLISLPGVDKDYKKAIHYYGLAAMGGLEEARTNLGCLLIEQSNESKYEFM